MLGVQVAGVYENSYLSIDMVNGATKNRKLASNHLVFLMQVTITITRHQWWPYSRGFRRVELQRIEVNALHSRFTLESLGVLAAPNMV